MAATLSDGRARTISQPAGNVGSKPTTMTSILDRLTCRDLLTRQEDPTSRRSVFIVLAGFGAAEG